MLLRCRSEKTRDVLIQMKSVSQHGWETPTLGDGCPGLGQVLNPDKS